MKRNKTTKIFGTIVVCFAILASSSHQGMTTIIKKLTLTTISKNQTGIKQLNTSIPITEEQLKENKLNFTQKEYKGTLQ